MRYGLPVLLGTVLLAACASTQFTPGSGGTAAPYDGEVHVLERLPPEGSYRMLGIVIVSGVLLTSDERMYRQLKDAAAARGADAVVYQGPIRVRPTAQGGEDRTLAAYAIRRN